MSSSFSTNIGIFFLSRIARLPFRLIYVLSGVLFVILYYVIGYRKTTVIKNLQNSFPEKNKAEIKTISKKFYRYFADLTMEVIKMVNMKSEDFRERMEFGNPEILNHFFERGQSVVLLTMHYCNWEWGSSISLFMRHKILAVYKPLHNKRFDIYMNKIRGNTGSELISNSKILRRINDAQKNGEPVIIGLIADQTPPVYHKFWMKFLNQETMFYQGPAVLAKRFNYPVLFQKIERTGRGKYRLTTELLSENPAEMSDTEIMKIYIDKMEEVIHDNPEFYLWSHRRWKHKRPENIPVQE